MNIRIESSYPPISTDDIALFESEIGATLPDDYRAFLLQYNGGVPEPDKIDIDTPAYNNRTIVTCLLGLNDDEWCSLRAMSLAYAQLLPRNLLPIATVLSVSLICMSTRGDDFGLVYYWDHNWASDTNPDYSNVHKIADSFTGLLGQLYTSEA